MLEWACEMDWYILESGENIWKQYIGSAFDLAWNALKIMDIALDLRGVDSLESDILKRVLVVWVGVQWVSRPVSQPKSFAPLWTNLLFKETGPAP